MYYSVPVRRMTSQMVCRYVARCIGRATCHVCNSLGSPHIYPRSTKSGIEMVSIVIARLILVESFLFIAFTSEDHALTLMVAIRPNAEERTM
jgi:hypothetical protein